MASSMIFRDNAPMSTSIHIPRAPGYSAQSHNKRRESTEKHAHHPLRNAAARPSHMGGFMVSLHAVHGPSILCLLVATALLTACSGPDLNAVANRLREENLDQKRQIADLQDKLKNRDATVLDLQTHFAMNTPPLPTLPPERLADVFTVARLEIQAQTDSTDLPDGKPGFRVFLRTYDADNQIVPASGTLTVEAFELPLAPAPPRRIGMWTFTAQEMKKNWYTGLGLNHFALSCPWSAPPTLTAITFRVRLRDALTGQTFEAQLDKKISYVPAAGK